MVQQLQRTRPLCSNLPTRATQRTQGHSLFQLQESRTLCKQLSRKDEEQVEQAYGETQPWPMSQVWKQRTQCKRLLREISPGSQENQDVI